MRTEEEILKDFEKLGFKILKHNYEIIKTIHMIRQSEYDGFTDEIYIDETSKKNMYFRQSSKTLPVPMLMDIQIHNLLHDLFELWGWI